jgi:hypothetical protein
MNPEMALFLLGLITLTEFLYRLYRLVRPNAGAMFA